MLNKWNIRIAFVVLLAVLLFLDYTYRIPYYSYILLLLALLIANFCGSYFIRLNYYVKSLNNGDRNRKAIAITFDDGPMASFTPQVLDILKENKVQSLFFLIGRNIAGNESLLERMNREGHIMGNHSYSHTNWFSLKPKKEMLNDLKMCDEEILRAAGKRVRFFRPPFGVTNPMVANAIEMGHYTSIGWSLRTYDTTAKDSKRLLTKTLKNLQNGDVILFHDWGRHTISILSDFIKGARETGFEIVRADELLGVKAYY